MLCIPSQSLTKCELKQNRSHTHKFTTSVQALHNTCIVFLLAIWLAPSLNNVREERLMFCVYSLLWQLLIIFVHCTRVLAI